MGMELLEKELVYRIVGCALTVHNTLGPGFREKTYENALCVEFQRQGIRFSQQSRYPVPYFQKKVDEFVPDLVVEGRVLVDTKTVVRILDMHRGILLNQLRSTELKVGLIINFKLTRLQWERFVYDTAARR
jgi:GxxExxY protein